MILIIDDDKSVTDRLVKFLKKEGYSTVGSYSGSHALDILKNNEIDLIITDMKMAGMSGLDVLKNAKEINPEVEVIMISGYPTVEIAVEAMKLGAYDYIQKPINLDELLILVNRCLEKKELANKLDTERKLRLELEKINQELKDMQDKLIQSEKLAAIGRLAAGVAHEINNPLTSVTMNLAFLKDDLKTETKIINRINIIDLEIDRISKIVSSLLNFSRKSNTTGKDTLVTIDVHEIIEKTLQPIEHQLNLDNIKVVYKFTDGLPKVNVNPNQIQQVFLNLITNARDSITEKRELNPPSFPFDKVGNREIVITTSLVEDKFIAISFEDTGNGISKESLSKIFEPFYTTKEPGKGTGLGLSVCHEIIKNHQGEVVVSSEISKGATFKVLLPIPR